MRRLLLFLCVSAIFITVPTAWADTYQGQVSFSPADLKIVQKSGYDLIEFKDGGSTDIVGAPFMPTVLVNVALPTDAQVTDLLITNVTYQGIEGVYNIMPATTPIHMSDKPAAEPFIRDPAFYDNDADFPAEVGKMLKTWDLVGQDFATIELYPMQYNPVTGKLRLAVQIDFEVVYEPAANPVRESYNFSDKNRAYYDKLLRKTALNPEGVGAMPRFVPKATTALDPGDYEYVVITYTTFVSAFQPLVDWRTEMGMPGTTVSTMWIYSNYTGASNQEKIRNFVIDANATWGTMYVLLGGDSGYVPYHTRTIDGDNIPNDTYYSDFDSDWKCEVYVGRACVSNATQINTFVNKVLTYEKNPPSNYGDKVFFMAFDADNSTKDEDCKIKIKDEFVPAYVTFSREYDSEAGGHESDVKAYMNAGQNLINHIDHGDTSIIGVGSIHHNSWLNTTEAQNFTNGTRYSNFYTVSCYSGNFPSTCWGEVFVRDDQGGITYVGNSRYGWYSPGNTNTLSNKYDQKWFEVLYLEGAYHAGETLAASLNKFFPFSSTYKYIFTELNLFGDPGLHLWTDNPVNLTATHASSIYTGSQNFTVNVKYLTTPIEGALVCAMKGTDAYGYGTTDVSGNAVFNIDPATAGTMTVTVTARNYKYSQSTVTVVVGNNPPTITDIVPKCGPMAGGTALTVTGANFTTTPAMTVSIGGTNCTGLTVVDPQTITCNAPSGGNDWQDVVVSNTYGNDTLPGAYRFFPVTSEPFNCTNILTNSLNTPHAPTLIVSGNAGTAFMAFLSFGPGPVNTPYGEMGLDNPLYYLFVSAISGAGYSYIPLTLNSGYGPLDFYIQILGYNGGGQPVWAYGGYNPHSGGSIWFHLNN